MNAAPPKISAPINSPTWCAGIIFFAIALGILATIFFFDPARNHFYPVCQFHNLTGWNCPGCGATRAAYALLHGNFPLALRDNALFVFGLFGFAVRAIWFAARKFFCKTTGEFFPAKFIWPLLFIAIVFSILRNLSAFAFLSPN
jgi:hypothetical protein